MEKTISTLFLVMAVSALITVVNTASSKRADDEITEKLKLLNKPAVKTIQSEDGDIIDCVDIYKQPALDHPALKDHIIQKRPSYDIFPETSSAENKTSVEVVFQTWRKAGSCPKGTVPIRRIRRKDLLRAASLDKFGTKNPLSFNSTATKGCNSNDVAQPAAMRYRSVAKLFTYSYNYIGASGDINVWNPRVESPTEYTTAQIWLKGGPGDNFESVEAGWVVNPGLYGDYKTRLFAYWTVNAYGSTGCFDLTCTGFVHTSSEIALGAAIEPTSSYPQQYDINVGLYLDSTTGSWWLRVNNKPTGYWPGHLFSYLSYSAIAVEWGGDVYSQHVKNSPPHTKTAMGSGYLAEDRYGYACFIKNVRIVDFSRSPKYPYPVSVLTDENGCYSVFNYVEGNGVEPVFFFGGPGQSRSCP